MSEPAKPEVVQSPCVGVCALDDDDICIGCWRSGEEISRWGYLDNAGKRAILKKVEERLKK
ncbi:MAG TPA: DUF1289 domain-containing protein [Dongiaceae bacterium]|nr:DUF1289 domain-containing protein [Dongiaceae bacterium]